MIPRQLGELPRLSTLDLSNNLLLGGLPAWLPAPGQRHLDRVALRYNGLSGPVPQGWCDGAGGRAATFDVRGNKAVCGDASACPAAAALNVLLDGTLAGDVGASCSAVEPAAAGRQEHRGYTSATNLGVALVCTIVLAFLLGAAAAVFATYRRVESARQRELKRQQEQKMVKSLMHALMQSEIGGGSGGAGAAAAASAGGTAGGAAHGAFAGGGGGGTTAGSSMTAGGSRSAQPPSNSSFRTPGKPAASGGGSQWHLSSASFSTVAAERTAQRSGSVPAAAAGGSSSGATTVGAAAAAAVAATAAAAQQDRAMLDVREFAFVVTDIEGSTELSSASSSAFQQVGLPRQTPPSSAVPPFLSQSHPFFRSALKNEPHNPCPVRLRVCARDMLFSPLTRLQPALLLATCPAAAAATQLPAPTTHLQHQPPCPPPNNPQIQEIHDGVMREAIAKHGGLEVSTEGDSFVVAFRNAAPAVAFSLEVQYRLLGTRWPKEVSKRGAFLVPFFKRHGTV